MNEAAQDWQTTRWSLLARLKNWEDQQSWHEFFEAYGRLIYSVARKAGLSEAEAQDVVQDTVLSVAKTIGAFRCDPGAGSFKAWLLRLTRWRILNQVKKRLPCPSRDSLSLGPEDEPRTSTVERAPDPASLSFDAIWDMEWEQSLLDAAKARVQQQVSAEQFQMFELYVGQGWPARGVAKLLGVSAGQVYLAKHRIGRLLKKEVQRLQSMI